MTSIHKEFILSSRNILQKTSQIERRHHFVGAIFGNKKSEKLRKKRKFTRPKWRGSRKRFRDDLGDTNKPISDQSKENEWPKSDETRQNMDSRDWTDFLLWLDGHSVDWVVDNPEQRKKVSSQCQIANSICKAELEHRGQGGSKTEWDSQIQLEQSISFSEHDVDGLWRRGLQWLPQDCVQWDRSPCPKGSAFLRARKAVGQRDVDQIWGLICFQIIPFVEIRKYWQDNGWIHSICFRKWHV